MSDNTEPVEITPEVPDREDKEQAEVTRQVADREDKEQTEVPISSFSIGQPKKV